MVFQFLRKTDNKKINWAEQITMERQKLYQKFKGIQELLVNNRVETSFSPGLVPRYRTALRESLKSSVSSFLTF